MKGLEDSCPNEVVKIKKIAVVSTGGTIAMRAGEGGLAHPELTGEELVKLIPSLDGRVQIEALSFRNVPSSHLTLYDLVELNGYIGELKDKGFDGVVITHGTDTMEETAYFLDITLECGIPVVLTGAQRNASLLSTDGPMNLMDSILVASDDAAGEMGVVIVFASDIVAAREATKFHRTRVDTFKSLELGPIGAVNNERVVWLRRPVHKDTYAIGGPMKRVDIIPSFLGADAALVHACLDSGTGGIVIEALGAGHLPPAMLGGIKRAVGEGIPVVMTSRVPVGRLLTGTYGYPGAEMHLRNMGVILGEDLSAWKARIKLLVLLSAGYTTEQIKHEFEKNMY